MEWMKAMIVDITKYRIEQSHVYKFEDEAKNIIEKAVDALRANKRLQE
jgi:predicted glycosyltransferase